MRALCVPGPDWHEATRSLRRAMILCGALSSDCRYECFGRPERGDAGAAHMEADDSILGIAEKHGFVETAEAFRGMKRWHS